MAWLLDKPQNVYFKAVSFRSKFTKHLNYLPPDNFLNYLNEPKRTSKDMYFNPETLQPSLFLLYLIYSLFFHETGSNENDCLHCEKVGLPVSLNNRVSSRNGLFIPISLRRKSWSNFHFYHHAVLFEIHFDYKD